MPVAGFMRRHCHFRNSSFPRDYSRFDVIAPHIVRYRGLHSIHAPAPRASRAGIRMHNVSAQANEETSDMSWTREQRNVTIAAYLGWTLDAFDFFLMVFVLKDIAEWVRAGPPGKAVRRRAAGAGGS